MITFQTRLFRSVAGPSAYAPARFLPALFLLASMQISALADTYYMDGKPIAKETYEAGLLVKQGASLLRINKNQEACQKLEQAVALAPDMAEAHHNYGLALAKLGKTDEACTQLQTALDENPGLDSTWLSLGGLYQSSGRIVDAVKTYKDFLSRFPKHRDAPKVAALVEGLSKEQSFSQQEVTKHAVAGTPARDESDYFEEVTRDGPLRWSSEMMPLRVVIHSGEGVSAYQPQYENILKKAFKDWQTASHDAVRFQFVKESQPADIECTWLGEPTKLANMSESGETRLSKLKKNNMIVNATIKLLTIPSMPGLPMTDNRMRMTCLHEIGHALGLNGHTTNPKDIMFFSTTLTDEYRDLTARDGNTVIRLYKE